MKIPIRTQAQLQRRIDAHVRRIEAAQRPFGKYRGSAVGFSVIYQAVLKSPVPVDYRYVTDALGLPPTVEYHYTVSGRLSALAKGGYLKEVGEGPRYQMRHGARLFAAVPMDQVARVQRRLHRAIKKMLRDPELSATTYRANEVPRCLATRIAGNGAATLNQRDRKIIELRLAGMSLKDIGAKFGITHERCRQIVERAVTGKSVRRVLKERIKTQAAADFRGEQAALDIIKRQLDNG